MGKVAKQRQDAVPDGGAEERVKRERSEFHLCKACRNGNQLADDGDEAADERRNGAVFAEVVFGLFDFLDVEQQEVPEAAVREFVDNRATENLGEEVVDVCSDERADCCEENDECDVEAGTWLQGFVGGGRHDEFRRERDERTFDGHQKRDCAVIQVVIVPVNNAVVNACRFCGVGDCACGVGGIDRERICGKSKCGKEEC